MKHTKSLPPVTVYAVELLVGAEYDSWVVDSLWDSEEKAKAYATENFRQSNWGSPVPRWTITPYPLNPKNP
jgi:hypothetical protein